MLSVPLDETLEQHHTVRDDGLAGLDAADDPDHVTGALADRDGPFLELAGGPLDEDGSPGGTDAGCSCSVKELPRATGPGFLPSSKLISFSCCSISLSMFGMASVAV